MRATTYVLRPLLKLALCLTPLGPALAQPPAQPQSDPATFSLVTGREPLISIGAPHDHWRFHPGDDPAYASPTFDDSTWPLLRPDLHWDLQGYKGLSGYAWYRFRIVLPPGTGAYDLSLPNIRSSVQVFLDGTLIRTTGSMGASDRYDIYEKPIQLPAPSPDSPTTLSIALRVWLPPLWAAGSGGGPIGQTLLGSRGAVRFEDRLYEAYFHYRLMHDPIRALLAALCGLAALALFLVRRSAREYLWFTVFSLAYALDTLLGYQYSGWTMEKINTIDGLLVAAKLAALVLLIHQILDRKSSFSYRLALAVALLSVLPSLAQQAHLPLSIAAENAWVAGFYFAYYLSLIFILIPAALRKDRNAQYLLIPVCLEALYRIADQFYVAARFFGYSFHWSISNLTVNVGSAPFTITPEDYLDPILFLGLLAVLLNGFLQAYRRQDRLAAELESARTLQQVLIPETLPTIPRANIQTAYHPASQVGGDFFQIIPLADQTTLILLGDVSGKGIPAALTVSLIVGAVRTLAEITQAPAEILAGLNRRLHGRPGFTTCLALHLMPTGFMTLSNAGHLSPYLNGAELETAAALPLGLDPDFVYAEQTVQLSSHDHLTLLTDGVLEAATPSGELYGFARTLAGSAGSAPVIAEAARSHGQNDDITVLTLDFA